MACHACQHLSKEILDIACRYEVHVAVMPCCQKGRSPGSTFKASSKNLYIPVAKVMDLLQCGRIMALGTHDVRLKCINSKITPQNRIKICRALTNIETSTFRCSRQAEVDKTNSKLELVYSKAHVVPGWKKSPPKNILNFFVVDAVVFTIVYRCWFRCWSNVYKYSSKEIRHDMIR